MTDKPQSSLWLSGEYITYYKGDRQIIMINVNHICTITYSLQGRIKIVMANEETIRLRASERQFNQLMGGILQMKNDDFKPVDIKLD